MQGTLNATSQVFGQAAMVPKKDSGGTIIPNAYIADPTFENGYLYGFSGVGLLVDGGAVQSVPTDANGNVIWPNPNGNDARTAIAWTAKGDFFLITASSQTWAGLGNWITTQLPALVDSSHTYGVAIQEAIMLDGGGSTQFGFKYTGVTPAVTDDNAEASNGKYIPTFLGVQYP